MKSRVYVRDARGYYRYSWYHYSLFWLFLGVLVFSVNILLYAMTNLDVFTSVSAGSLIFCGLILIYEFFKLISGIRTNHGLKFYLQSLRVEKWVRKAILNTMNLNLLKDTPRIEVPAIKVRVSQDSLEIDLMRLPGMNDLEKLTQDINSSLKGKFRGFAVVEAIQEEDGSKFCFRLEDVSTDKTFRPTKLEDLFRKPYFVKLQEGLTVNLASSPHIAVWGQSGSGKTTVLMSIISQCFSNGSEIYFIDGKAEFSSFSVFYPSERIATDNEKVLQLLKHVSEIIMKRQKVVADAVKKKERLGLKGFDIKLKPIILIADEVGSIKASMSSKEKKDFDGYFTQVAQKGRSVSVFLIVASQSPAVDVLPQGIRSQFATKILLGSASGEVQRMAFGEVVTKGSVPKFQGYYMLDGKTVLPQKYFVPDLFAHGLENMKVFKKLYKRGLA